MPAKKSGPNTIKKPLWERSKTMDQGDHFSGHKGSGGKVNNKIGKESHSNNMKSGEPHTMNPSGAKKCANKMTGFANQK